MNDNSPSDIRRIGRPSPEEAAILDFLERRSQDQALRNSLAVVPESARRSLLGDVDELEQRLESLIEATQKAQEPLSLDLMLTRLVALMSEAFGADRSTLFLYDNETEELFSRVAQGKLMRELRFNSRVGIAGYVFTTGTPAIIDDAYADPRFNRDIDQQTGYQTRNILGVPVRTRRGDIIGVAEVLNKRHGSFSLADAVFLRAFTSHMATAIENAQLSERARASSREESRILEVTQAISSELDLDQLLRKIISVATELLDAERSSLFLHDPLRDELWSRVAEGLHAKEIRIPAHTGIAGEVFTSRQPVNIADVYVDPRFNPDVDKRTGFRTRSILCVPVINRHGMPIGVVQVLNQRNGVFSPRDQRRLEMLAAQSAIALENARLFQEVLAERNYNENVLRSLTNGVITLDLSLNIVKINQVAASMLGFDPERVLGASATRVFRNGNAWIRRAVRKVMRSHEADVTVDATLKSQDGRVSSVNVSVSPLLDPRSDLLGYAIVIEDITKEMRVRSTMARYMTREVAEQVLAQGESVLGGRAQQATILFTDIANFTNLTERIGPQETVALLNEYFTEMVEPIFNHNGILDKYIGDAIMAVFGAPFGSARDADNALLAAIAMQRVLMHFNAGRVAAGERPIDVRIGINSAQVVAGNIGSVRRMDYTVIGDGVNLAARLESANRHYGTRILVSASTVDLLHDRYRLRELDWLRVRGKAAPIPVFEVLGRDDEAAPASEHAVRRHYEAGLTAYRQRDWHGALAHFHAALTSDSRDGPSAIMAKRAAAYLLNPPGDEWEGVFVLTDK